MGKRFWSLALSVAMIGGVFAALPAHAQAEPGATGGVVPATPNIVDEAGDANGYSSLGAGIPGTVSLTGADVLAAWFTHDATNVYVHIQTATNARVEATTFQTTVGTAAGLDCLQLRMVTAGVGNESFSAINSTGDCGEVATTQYGPLLEEVGPEDTSILTGTFPRAGLTQLAGGALLAEPDILVGLWGHGNPVAGGSRILTIDSTPVGTDYSIASGVSGGPGKPSAPTEPPGKGDPPGKGKKKGCPKGKGQKKGACPKPKPANSCPAYVPGEQGATAPTSIVTAAATEEKPVEVTIAAPAGDPTSVPATYQNIQVDAAAAEAGLYVRYEFPTEEDHDIYLNYADGSEAAHAAGFNQAPFVPNNPVFFTDGTGAGGHSEQGAEQLDGIRSGDCAGYTLQMDSFLSMGGDMTLKLWLGEIQNDPAAPGGGAEAAATDSDASADSDALTSFYNLTGLANPSVKMAQASSTRAADKGCKKGKGKKKGCKKPPVACATFVPGEAGTDKPLLTVTDAATEEAPVEQTINLDLSTADVAGDPTSDAFNIQVDSAAADAGLYVLFEFPMRRDYDLNLLHPDGSYAARSRRFNTVSETTDQGPFPISANGHGGAGTDASEKLDGIRTADCGGWTLQAENWLGEGGEFTIKVWLGEAKVDPQAPGEEPPS